MKLAIIYATKHGCTAEIAASIAQLHPNDETTLISLKTNPKPDLSSFDVVILGGPVYFGQPLPAFRQFIQNHTSELASKPLGIFLVGLNEKAAMLSFDNAIPQKLINHAYAVAFVGGVLSYKTMSFWEKWLMKLVLGAGQQLSLFKPELLGILHYKRNPNPSSALAM
jgi:menaquinone-dependent protoporphyrinogen IX oxidase